MYFVLFFNHFKLFIQQEAVDTSANTAQVMPTPKSTYNF